MSNRISAAEKAARTFLKPFILHWSYYPERGEQFIVNLEGHPREQRSEIQWLLKKGWVKRTREPALGGRCPNRQITRMVLTALGRRKFIRRVGGSKHG